MITREQFEKKFNYDHLTGELYYKRGKKAGWTSDKGYRKVRAYNKVYYIHRLVFWYFHGYWPKLVDHINRDKGDNRIENLRDISFNENLKNRDRNSNNKSGFKNVYWHKASNKYLWVIMTNGKPETLGRWKTLEEVKQYFTELDE